jgi:pyrimidine 5'-nucleotidase
MFHTLLFDLDNTIYPKSAGVMAAVGERIYRFMEEFLDIDPATIPSLRRQLFTKYGTTLIGLKHHFEFDQQEYLDFVHNLDLSKFLMPDPKLNNLLSSLPHKKVIFTNADVNHAKNILNHLEISRFFIDIIDIHKILPYVKPHPEAYDKALACLGYDSWDRCLFIDDSLQNILSAEKLGLRSIFICENNDSDYPDAISSIFYLPRYLKII